MASWRRPSPLHFPLALPLILWFCVLVNAQNTTAQESTSTSPCYRPQDAIVGWVNNPKRRGTLTLLIECLTTIIACTWTVLHLNAPAISDSTMTRLGRKAKWMGITMFFPEFVFAKAVCELRLALYTLDRMYRSILLRRQKFEHLTKVERKQPEASHVSWVLWTWAVEFGWLKRKVYTLLLWETPLADFYEPTLGRIIKKWLSELGATIKSWPSKMRSVFCRCRCFFRGCCRSSGDCCHPSGDCCHLSSVRCGSTQQKTPSEEKAYATRTVPVKTTGGEEIKIKFYNKSFSDEGLNPVNGSSVARVQKWTPTHAYYVNMGGLVALKWVEDFTPPPEKSSSSTSINQSPGYAYSVVRGEHLPSSKLKTWPEDIHPLKQLRLSAEDIKDKCKADWIVKTLAVIQIARLIFDLVTRGIAGQPVTQLEIATASFAVFAMVTYMVNVWKPKEIAQPTKIHEVIEEGKGNDVVNLATESFFDHLWNPTKLHDNYGRMMSRSTRVKNDEIWKGGKKPTSLLAWSMMAGSCVVFGGIHCVAWSFEFPTRVEQLAWRTAALVSMILPLVAIVGSCTILVWRPPVFKHSLVNAVEGILGNYGKDLLGSDHDWWDVFTTAINTERGEQWKAGKLEGGTNSDDMERLTGELVAMRKLRDLVRKLQQSYDKERRENMEGLLDAIWNTWSSLNDEALYPRTKEDKLRAGYEGWVKNQVEFRNGRVPEDNVDYVERGESEPDPNAVAKREKQRTEFNAWVEKSETRLAETQKVPIWDEWIKKRKNGTLDQSVWDGEYRYYYRFGEDGGLFQWIWRRCALMQLEVWDEYQEVKEKFETRAKLYLRFLNAVAGIFYTAARLVLLSIMVSSLRAAPNGVYDTPTWTSFVPNFS